jgi:hypothetical protein
MNEMHMDDEIDTYRADQANRNAAWQLTRAKSALENWGRHHGHCAYYDDGTHIGAHECTCGLAQAIRDADPVIVANSVSPANTESSKP